MKKVRISSLLLVMTTAALLLAACSAGAASASQKANTTGNNTAVPTTGSTSGNTATSMPAASSGGATVMLSNSADMGDFLVDSNGMTLYAFTNDSPGKSTCTGDCLTKWPPLLTTGTPMAGDGVDASLLGTITRDDGTTQVTYNGWPLYNYTSDSKAGDTIGEAVGNVWYMVAPDGTMIKP